MEAVERVRGEKVGTFRDRYGDEGRDLILWLARANTELTLGRLGSWAGGVGGSSVSMAIARVTAKLKTNRALARQLQAIINLIPKCEM